MFVKTQRTELTSIGVDVGSSTSHVVFSRITLEKDTKSRTEKFEITNREIIYSGPIHLTPFIDKHTIDFEALRKLFLDDYAAAGIDVSAVDTGAVIITGETAKKQNAEEIVSALAGEAGKFVAASAGPNFESVLAAFGSGAVAMSETEKKVIMNVDIGGGSSNIAICKDGKIIETGAINVGGRLIATDSNGIIVRLEDTGINVANELGYELELGYVISEEKKKNVAQGLARALMECLEGKNESNLTKMLMMTEALRIIEPVDIVTFSGGVAEYIYGVENKEYYDLGKYLAASIIELLSETSLKLAQPEHRIRATVIGAGQCSLKVSGSTTFLSTGLDYPMRNLPAIVPNITRNASEREIAMAIKDAFKRFDLVEGEDKVIISFKDAVRPSYDSLTKFARGVIAALPKTVKQGKPIMMCFDTDIGNSVGNVMKRETGIENELLSIDEITLDEGDFVDIGEPIIEGIVVPVVIKTLVFDN
ncbi:MAG: ethanolamine utilization protein EutA [Candidatus Lokiarchaeota archaeon]|nr:ethanolamine utilization protein EutA [Candidatus Lokiarchaeota archaeon]